MVEIGAHERSVLIAELRCGRPQGVATMGLVGVTKTSNPFQSVRYSSIARRRTCCAARYCGAVRN